MEIQAGNERQHGNKTEREGFIVIAFFVMNYISVIVDSCFEFTVVGRF